MRPRVRGEEGMTLVELLIAMFVLTVGILALVAAYSSGYVALNRATEFYVARILAMVGVAPETARSVLVAA